MYPILRLFLPKAHQVKPKRYKMYRLTKPWIRVTVEAYIELETGDLIIDGYDIGKRVQEAFGDSDYEYQTRILATDKSKLMQALGVSGDDKKLLRALVKRFHGNKAYSDFLDWCTEQAIQTDSWAYS